MAALDFPNTPAVNQVYTAAGASWQWDGVKWVVQGPPGKALLSGSNLSDVASVPTSRTNLGLGTIATQNANAVAITGGTITGGSMDGVPIGGTTASTANFTNMSATGTATFGGTVNMSSTLTVASTISSPAAFQSGAGGAAGGFQTFDRTSPYTASALFYRSGATAYLWLNDYGNVIAFNNSGSGSIGLDWTVGRNLTVNGTVISAPTLTANGAQFTCTSGNSYPVYMVTQSNGNCCTQKTVSSVRAWVDGPFTSGAYVIYDVSGSRQHISFNVSNNTIVSADTFRITGDAGGNWSSSMIETSTISGLVPWGFAGYTGTAGYNPYYSRVDITTANLMWFGYGTSNMGTITTTGSACYYNSICDGALKDNVRPLVSEIDVGSIIDAIAPVRFEWLTTPDHPTDVGFVAQDLHTVVPNVVTPARPGVPAINNETGEFEIVGECPWQADVSKLMPYVIAEMQQMRKRIAQLEGRA